MGKPVPGWDVSVVDDDGARGRGRRGRQRRRPRARRGGRSACSPATTATRRRTRGAFRGDWYFTGDKAAVDEDGYFWFEGRDDDVITSSAYRIGPFEVESALVEHPAVMEAAVVGRDDPERTQIVVGVCVLAPGQRAIAGARRRDPGLGQALDRALQVPA